MSRASRFASGSPARDRSRSRARAASFRKWLAR
jgi:hypothetical protein